MKTTKNLIRNCEVCSGLIGDVLHNQKFVVREGVPSLTDYDIVACQKCGFIFADTPLSQDEYNFYYSDFSKYEDKETASGGNIKSFDINRFEAIVNGIENLRLGKNIKILDIGCANGGLLDTFRKHGYGKLYGIDPSPKCVDTVKERGYVCEHGTIFNARSALNKNTFNVVILSHVLEHIKDLKKAVQEISNLICDGGILYIEVPDAEMYEQYYHGPYYYFDYEHINHFDCSSIANLFSEFSFNVIVEEHKEMTIEGGVKYPALGICLKRDINKKVVVKPDFNLRRYVCNFIELSTKNNKVNELIRPYVKNQEKVIIWGAGQYTQRLFASTDLLSCNITCLVDKDSNKIGGKISGIDIKNIKCVLEHDGIVFVASALYSSEIMRELKEMGFVNKVLVLN